MSFKCVELNKMDNEMFYYVCVGGQMVKDTNWSIENKGGRIITLLVNVHMPLDKFVVRRTLTQILLNFTTHVNLNHQC